MGFFHSVTQLRNNYNAIRLFSMANGTIISNPLEMSDHDLSHFTNILGPAHYQGPSLHSPTKWFTDLLGFSCSQVHYAAMETIPDCVEIQKTYLVLMQIRLRDLMG